VDTPENPQAGASTTPDDASHALQDGIRSAEQSLGQAVSSAAAKFDHVRDEATTALEKSSVKAGAAARRGADVFREASGQLRDKGFEAVDGALAYAEKEPLRALLIAAATGALLMALLSRMVRSND
jgi:ElaB/YqjD/DUF883 family membrane-anchored ribosome-binding protein